MLVLSNRLACATASITSTTSFGHGPRSSTVLAMSGNLPTHHTLVKTNKRITKLPIRRLPLAAQKKRDMALACSALLSDVRLGQSAAKEILNYFCPVHNSIITYVIAESKHQRDCGIVENHIMETLAKRLSAKREELGLSQQELAKKAKLKSQSIIGMLESGARRSSSHIPAIANALGVESLWLSSGIGPESRADAKTYELSEHAMKIALLANDMSVDQQLALLNFLSTERVRSGDSSIPVDQKTRLPG